MAMNKLLIANRSEIAVRIIRAARELGVKTVQVYSEADADSLAVKMADESVLIGPAKASDSYLNIEKIITAARQYGTDAIHPGYGFLAENPEFAERVTTEGLIFIGPNAAVLRSMGDKISARQTAEKAGVMTVPGSQDAIDDLGQAYDLAAKIGFPVMIKAAGGGGGRGIRVAENPDEFKTLAPQASAESKAAFNDDRLYIEKFIHNARHLEVQILGDANNVIHCFERECSLQRRRQKIWEEAPAACIDDTTREQMCAAAVKLAKAVKYCGAGTIEFLYDEDNKAFYFIEMNTRIQVEHPVTEMITGIDLVKEMIKVASGEPLSFSQEDVRRSGHAIEVRLNAENPAQNFFPSPGTIDSITLPTGPGVRFDGAIYSGYTIPPFYDSLIGKLIVWDHSRVDAIRRLSRSLDEFNIEGISTTMPLFQALLDNDDIGSGDFNIHWLEKWLIENADHLATTQEPC